MYKWESMKKAQNSMKVRIKYSNDQSKCFMGGKGTVVSSASGGNQALLISKIINIKQLHSHKHSITKR